MKKASTRRSTRPIDRTGTTPEFWKNWDETFGGNHSDPPEKEEREGDKSGQGFKLTKEDQKAVELQAMKKASEFWKKQGFAVKDVSKNHPYDLEVSREREVFYVEVKGTVTEGAQFLLTDREKTFAAEHIPQMRLFFLASIQLVGEKGSRNARGGTIVGNPLEVWDVTKKKSTATTRTVTTWTVRP